MCETSRKVIQFLEHIGRLKMGTFYHYLLHAHSVFYVIANSQSKVDGYYQVGREFSDRDVLANASLWWENNIEHRHIDRTGWTYHNITKPESVAAHMYRMSVMVMLLPDCLQINKLRCYELAIAHDIGECIVGDITPYCNISIDEKHKREQDAIDQLSQLIEEKGTHFKSIYEEYRLQITPESNLIKEFDRLDMILQAYEYEKQESSPGMLEDFFQSCKGKFVHPFTVQLVQEIEKLRSNHKR